MSLKIFTNYQQLTNKYTSNNGKPPFHSDKVFYQNEMVVNNLNCSNVILLFALQTFYRVHQRGFHSLITDCQ